MACRLTDDGKTRVQITRSYYGGDFGEKHRFFAELPPEERNRYFQEAVSGVAQGARAVGDLTTDFDHYPGVEKFTVEITHYCVVDGKNMYFNLPFVPSLMPPAGGPPSLPLFIDGAMDNTVRTEIALAPQFQHLVITPAPGQPPCPTAAKARRSPRPTPRGSGHQLRIQTTPSIVAPGNYPAMLKLESTLSKKSSRVFLLSNKECRPLCCAPGGRHFLLGWRATNRHDTGLSKFPP